MRESHEDELLSWFAPSLEWTSGGRLPSFGASGDWEYERPLASGLLGAIGLSAYFGERTLPRDHRWSATSSSERSYNGLRVQIVGPLHLAWELQQGSAWDPATHWLLIGFRW